MLKLEIKNDDLAFVEEMIRLMKPYLLERFSSLTLVFFNEFTIQTAIKIKEIVEND